MDVHPPHHPIRSWQEFLLHLLTITVGLLIALALEAAVEAVHHRHLVRDARENLRREIESNHQLFAKNAQNLKENRALLTHNIELLRDLRGGKKLQTPDLNWHWAWSSYRDAAWRSAREIGAVPYMDLQSIEDYSLVYSQQTYVNDIALAIVGDETKIAAPLRITQDANALQPSEIQAMLLATAEADMRMETLQSLMRFLDEDYAEALKTP